MVLPFLVGLIVQTVVGVALSVAATLIQSALAQNKKQPQPGVRGEIQGGGDNPLAFIVGKYATAGQFEYAGTWGEDGGTPNANYTRVVSVSDLPVRGLSGFYVNGARVTLDETPHETLGYPVTDFRIGGKDHLWVKFYDGTQTEADAYLLDKFGSDEDRPWQSDMIGEGVAYFIATALVNRELFTNLPDYLAEINGIELATDKHDNPVEAIRKIMLGLSYDGTWVYGPQGVTANHLPGWDAQSDKCDVSVDVGEGSEARFRAGYEITVDTEPHVAIGEFLKACQGRIAEVGGRYKLLVGEPDEPVVSFTDEDITISEGQSYDPFPGLEDTYNAITATYPEPDEAWGNKDAPPRYSSELEDEDNDRRLPFDTAYPAVPYANQVQRLMRAEIEEARRFRRHVFTMPPEWWEFEPLDVAPLTSTRNGYDAKQFLIITMEDLPNGFQVVGFQEIEPDDYSWSTDYELSYDVTPLVVARPPAQAMTGWQVAPYVFVDSGSNGRRPGIEVSFAGELDDVRAVRVQVRLDATEAKVFDGESPYDITVESPSVALSGTFLRATDYEARGRFLPFSGRETEWSDWLAVTTPDVGFGPNDLNASLNALLQRVDSNIPADLLTMRRDLDELAGAVNAHVSTILERLGRINIGVGSRYQENKAAVELALLATTTGDAALAALIASLFAETEYGDAAALFRMITSSAPDGVAAMIEAEVRASAGASFASAGWRLLAGVTALSGGSALDLLADRVTISDGTTRVPVATFESGTAYIDDLVARNIAADTIDAGQIKVNAVTLEKIIADAISTATVANTAGTLSIVDTSEATAQTIAPTRAAGSRLLMATSLNVQFSLGEGTFTGVTVRIKRGSTTLFSQDFTAIGLWLPIHLSWVDTDSVSGSQTYTMTVQGTGGASGMSVSNRYLHGVEFRR